MMVEGKNYTIVWLGLKYIEITTKMQWMMKMITSKEKG